MLTKDYYIEALQNGMYKYLAWITDCFSVSEYTVVEGDTRVEDLDPYTIFKFPADDKSLYFADPENGGYGKLEEYKVGEPLMKFLDPIELKPNDLPNLDRDVTTTYGNALVNMYILVYPFGNKIPFMEGKIDGGRVLKVIGEKLHDNVPENQRTNEFIYADEFIKHSDAVSSLEGFTLLAVPSTSIETLKPTSGVLKLRDELLAKHKDELNNPAVVISIMNQLAAYEKEALKDTEAAGYYLSGKSYDVIRMKRFIMYGLEGGFGDGPPQFITRSLDEGWNMDNFPSLVDGMRSGSYGRGFETAIGGEWVKIFQRVFQNVTLVEDDCGNNNGMRWLVTEWNYKRFDGLNRILPGNKYEMLTADTAKTLIGQVIEVRTPMLCRVTYPNLCRACCGRAISNSEGAIHSIVARVGSVFMGVRMAKIHGKSAKTNKFTINGSFS